jgi:hypothetical protein
MSTLKTIGLLSALILLGSFATRGADAKQYCPPPGPPYNKLTHDCSWPRDPQLAHPIFDRWGNLKTPEARQLPKSHGPQREATPVRDNANQTRKHSYKGTVTLIK